MKSKSKYHIGIGFGFVGLLAPIASGQTYTEIVREGDPMFGNPAEMISRIDNVAINNNGDWLIELDTDGPSTGDAYLVHNGTVYHQEGTSLGISSPAGAIMGSFIDTVEINDNGDILTIMRVTDSNGDQPFLLIRNGTTIIETGTTPCNAPGLPAGTFYSGLAEAWQNNNGELLVGANVALGGTGSTSILLRIDVDGAGNILSETKIAMVGETLPGPNHVTPIQGFSFSEARCAINDNGDIVYMVDDEHAVMGGSTLSDSNVYVNSTLLYNEADPHPAPGNTFPFDTFTSAEYDINNSGVVLINGDDRNTVSAQDGWLFTNDAGTSNDILAHDTDPPPAGFVGGTAVTAFGFGGKPHLSDFGDVLWVVDVDTMSSSEDKGIMYNNSLLMQEGNTMIGPDLVTTVADSDNELEMSDSGQLGILEVVVNTDTDVVYQVQFADAIGSAYCDPANNNTTGFPGVLTAVGSDFANFNNVTLQASGLPTGEFGFFLNGTGNNVVMNAGGSSGDLCVSTAIGRYNAATEIFNSGMDGTGSLTLDLNDTPTPLGPTTIMAGETWYFQCWYRDTPGATSNFTNGVEINFQ